MGGSPASETPLTEELRELALQALKEWKVPGLSIAVIDGDEVYAEGYGYATLPDVPASPESVYYCASTSKAFTAALLSHWIHEKRFPEALAKGWQTPISSVIRDDFVLSDEWATAHITLEDAASHRTGIGRHDKSSAHVVDGGRAAAPRDTARNLRNLDMSAEPRVRFIYSNLMYVTLSHVLETLGGKWLGDLLKEEIWDPLGMNDTFFDPDAAKNGSAPFAAGYYWDPKEERFHRTWDMPVSEVSGAGAILSNVLDYAKWVKALILESRPFSKETHEDLRTPRMTDARSPDDVKVYGSGWHWRNFHGQSMYSHAGGMHAYGAEVFWLPSCKFGVVALGNTGNTSNAVAQILAYKLIQDHLGVAEQDRYIPTKTWKDVFKDVEEHEKDALSIAFPDRPRKPLPLTCDIKDLAGTYHNAGYGFLTFRVENDESGQDVLVADSFDKTWPSRTKLSHISGDWWLGRITLPKSPNPLFNECSKTRFSFGPTGKPRGLESTFITLMDGQVDGSVSYDRIE